MKNNTLKNEKKKITTLAFTLVELIGVITLLGLIMIIVTPPIINQIRNSEGKLDEATETLIYSATDLYIDSKKNDYPKNNDNIYCVTLKELVDDGKLKEPILNSKGKEIDLNKYVKIEVKNNQYKYLITDECSGIIQSSILTSTDACLKDGSVCSNGVLVNVKVNDNEDYDFYIIDDDGENLTLIMNQNLGDNVAWIIKEDYIAFGGTTSTWSNSSSGRINTKGPRTALKTLEERTSDWTNIPLMTYVLIDDKPDADGTTARYSPIEIKNLRARMLTYTEAVSLGCEFNKSGSCPEYLRENLVAASTSGQPSAYWLSTARSFSNTYTHAFKIMTNTLGGDYAYDINFTGVRPVIKISKKA